MKKIITTTTILGCLLIAPSVLANEVSKEGTEIKVQEPEVTVTKSDDTVYADVNTTIKTEIPDEVAINEGDTLTYQLPEQLQFNTDYNFPVNNNEGVEVGQAQTSATENTVKTTFNNYFQDHPLDKSFNLNFTTKYNREIVKKNETINLNFNGTIIQNETGDEPGIDKNE